MPTYEYRCPQGHEFELVQKMTARPQAKCPRCGRVAGRQISGGADLIFKGSGFYITDYGKDGKRDQRDKATESKKEGEKEAKTATKTDAEPESASAPKAESKSEKSPPPEKKAEPNSKPDSSSKGSTE